MAKIEALLNGKGHHYQCAEQVTLLEQALQEQISLPFSCMSGSCTTCKGRLLSGRVEMADHSSLTQAEIEQGWILTCQAYPRSETVKVEIPQD